MKHTLGLGHFTFLDLSPIALVRLARAASFDFVGLRFYPVAPGQLQWLPDTAGLTELSHVMEGEGIGLHDIDTIVIDAALDPLDLVPAFDAAASLGARRVNTCADMFPGLVPTFAQICQLAAERGLGVDIECMAWRGIDNPHACLKLIEDSGASNAAYLVDVLHHTRCGGTARDLTEKIAPYIVSAQLCDAPSAQPVGHEALNAEARGGRLMPGQGGLPLLEILTALPEQTFFSVELPCTADKRPPHDRAREIYIATMALLDSATSIRMFS